MVSRRSILDLSVKISVWSVCIRWSSCEKENRMRARISLNSSRNSSPILRNSCLIPECPSAIWRMSPQRSSATTPKHRLISSICASFMACVYSLIDRGKATPQRVNRQKAILGRKRDRHWNARSLNCKETPPVRGLHLTSASVLVIGQTVNHRSTAC